LETKESTQPDENQLEETQDKQDDEMELDQGDGHDVVSPITEQSRRDRKFWKSYIYPTLMVPDKRKASEAASVFSDSTRDRKRTREDSQPVDEDEPGKFLRLSRPFAISQVMSRSCAPARPAACY
jgi:hypothetical protein